jgi:hypothetical protein
MAQENEKPWFDLFWDISRSAFRPVAQHMSLEVLQFTSFVMF